MASNTYCRGTMTPIAFHIILQLQKFIKVMHRSVNQVVWGSNLCRVISVYVSEVLKISAAWEVNISPVFPNITDDG